MAKQQERYLDSFWTVVTAVHHGTHTMRNSAWLDMLAEDVCHSTHELLKAAFLPLQAVHIQVQVWHNAHQCFCLQEDSTRSVSVTTGLAQQHALLA